MFERKKGRHRVDLVTFDATEGKTRQSQHGRKIGGGKGSRACGRAATVKTSLGGGGRKKSWGGGVDPLTPS